MFRQTGSQSQLQYYDRVGAEEGQPATALTRLLTARKSSLANSGRRYSLSATLRHSQGRVIALGTGEIAMFKLIDFKLRACSFEGKGFLRDTQADRGVSRLILPGSVACGV